MKSLKQSHSAKNVKGIPFGIFNVHFVAKYQTSVGGPFGDLDKFSKSQCRKKLKAGPFSLIPICMLP